MKSSNRHLDNLYCGKPEAILGPNIVMGRTPGLKKVLTGRYRFDIVACEKCKFLSFKTKLKKKILVKSQLYKAPFSFLPEKATEDFLSHFSSETIKKDTILLAQEISSIEKFLVLSQGSAQYYLEHNNEKTLQGRLNQGDNFDGISILLNDGVAIRTLKVLEDSVFLSLDADIFLKTCAEFEEFKAFFTNAFGNLMLNKSYAGIIARQIKDKDEKGKVDAIITDTDLRNGAVAKGLNDGHPASAIVSSPIVSVPADAQVFKAFITMIGEDRKHLAVTSKANEIIGTISDRDLIAAQASSTYLRIKAIKSAKNVNQLENSHSKMALMLLDPIRNGANPEYITRLITTISDAILDKVLEFSIAKLGEPPCKFAFMIMGSEGRKEQTLVSDQDNGIIYEDLKSDKDKAYASEYFGKLAEMVCDQLNTAGYKFCDGECMAKNPKWCQSLLSWKKYFHSWIYQGSPEDLLHSSIFFDFKGVWGDLELTDQLKLFLLDCVEKRAGFLRKITTIIDEERQPDNYINPSNLSYLDNALLKEVFKKIEQLQGKLKSEFIGTA